MRQIAGSILLFVGGAGATLGAIIAALLLVSYVEWDNASVAVPTAVGISLIPALPGFGLLTLGGWVFGQRSRYLGIKGLSLYLTAAGGALFLTPVFNVAYQMMRGSAFTAPEWPYAPYLFSALAGLASIALGLALLFQKAEA